MKRRTLINIFGIMLLLTACNKPATNLTYENPDYKVLFLHHSTGNNVWHGDINPYSKIYLGKSMCMVPRLIKEYNEANGVKISVEERNFPKGNPYPWENYPFDYYNIWVKNAGETPFIEEPTLEILTKDYNLIILKHCFPVSSIMEDDGTPDINSKNKTLSNYKLQYNALKEKMHEFPQTRFLVWTGSALAEGATDPGQAQRAQEFARWVTDEWDQAEDNISIFDFRQIETDGGLFLKPQYATSATNSHPNIELASKSAGLLVKAILNIFETDKK